MSSNRKNTSKRIEDIFKKRKSPKYKKGIDRSQGNNPLYNQRNMTMSYKKLSIKTTPSNTRSTFI